MELNDDIEENRATGHTSSSNTAGSISKSSNEKIIPSTGKVREVSKSAQDGESPLEQEHIEETNTTNAPEASEYSVASNYTEYSGETANNYSNNSNNSDTDGANETNKTLTDGDDSDTDNVSLTLHSLGSLGSLGSLDGLESEELPPKLKYTRITSLPATFFTNDPVSTCNFHDSYFFFATHSGFVHITTPSLKTVRTFRAHRASVLSIFTDGHFFATGSMDGTVVVGSILDEKDIVAYDFQRPIHSVVLDRNYAKTRGLVSGGMSGKVIYSTRNWLGKRSDVVLDEGSGPVVGILVVDDILLWMNEKGITLSNIVSRQVISVIPRPSDSPRSDLYWPRVSFPETDRILVAWGYYIWSLRVSVGGGGGEVASSGVSRLSLFRVEKKVEVERVVKVGELVSGVVAFRDDLWMVTAKSQSVARALSGGSSGEKLLGSANESSLKNLAPAQSTLDQRPRSAQSLSLLELKLINSSTGEVEFEEELGLRNSENLGINDFLLGKHIGNTPRYFVVSARDGVIAEELSLHDRLEWYLARERYYDAWEISEHLVTEKARLNFGVLYVDNLVREGEWEHAGAFLARLLVVPDPLTSDISTVSSVLTADREGSLHEMIHQWETWAEIFLNSGQIPVLTNIIPKSPKLLLLKSIYMRILQFWLKEDLERLRELTESWDVELYDIKRLEEDLEGDLEVGEYGEENEELEIGDIRNSPETSGNSPSSRRTNLLHNLLISLYDLSANPTKSIPHLIALHNPNIIQYLSSNHILSNFKDDLAKFVRIRFQNNELDTFPIAKLQPLLKDIVKILVENQHEIVPLEIISHFLGHHLSFISFFYLEELAAADPFVVEPFSDILVSLYAQYSRQSLLLFLQRHNNYNISDAIAICEENDYSHELVYLLGKIGENEKAILLIITKINDPSLAIEFARSQNDRQCWDVLLKNSMDKPNFIRALIEFSDEQSLKFYDPIDVLMNMSGKVRILGLNKSIIKFHISNDLNLLINQLILRGVDARGREVSEGYRSGLLRGVETEIL